VVRRALALATGEQYVRLAINFALIVTVSRLLTPTEIGVSVIGIGIMQIALGLRQFATSDFLIQRQEVTQYDIRASFTVLFLLTALIVSAMFVLAPWFGSFYGEDKLASFLRIAAVAGLIEAVSMPIKGLLRREMAFGALALISTASASVTALVTILLALLGFSYMSMAWAMVAAAVTITFLSFYFRSDLSILRPTLRCWSNVLTFGGYTGASYAIDQTHGALPQLVLGHVLPHSVVGLYNRAQVVSDIPDRIVLASATAVAFPALAAAIRQGCSLKEPYLRALGHITVFFWPALVLLAILAYPAVSLLLGRQWLEVVPLLQVMAVGGLAWFPATLTTPVLLAVGANRDRVLAVLVTRSVSGVVLCGAAYFGVMAMVASRLVTQPYLMFLSLWFVRRHIPFRWREVWAALWKSAVVTASTAAGAICAVAVNESNFDLPIAATAMAVVLAVVGWLTSVVITEHPVLLELKKAAEDVAQISFVQRCMRSRKPITAHRGRPRTAEDQIPASAFAISGPGCDNRST
jgi:O-antigen/teichoic acid export membrane protein